MTDTTPVDVKLLPCPFCGSSEIDPKGWMAVDGREGPACDDCSASAYSVEHWNTRLRSSPPGGADGDQIKHMVDRFLMWPLPEDFNPDGGISFQRMFNEHTPWPRKAEPVGTNLFDATQAEAMIRYMLEGLPAIAKAEAAPRCDCGAMSAQDCNDLPSLRHCGGAEEQFDQSDLPTAADVRGIMTPPAVPVAEREEQVDASLSEQTILYLEEHGWRNDDPVKSAETVIEVIKTVQRAALRTAPAPVGEDVLIQIANFTADEISTSPITIASKAVTLARTALRKNPAVSEWALCEQLRAGEGNQVTLISDNADFNGQPNCAVECCGDWTGWEPVRFTGNTMREALQAALARIQQREG